MGSKVDGHWTLPYKMTLGRPLPNSKPFQIPTEDNSLFLSLSPFSDFVFFKFFTNSLSIVSPPQSLGTEEGSKVGGHWTLPLDLTPKLDLFQIQNPFKSILRTLPSFLFCILSNFDIFQNFAKSTPIPNLTHSLWTTNLLSHSVHRRVLQDLCKISTSSKFKTLSNSN